MKISFNDKELYSLNPTQCNVLCDYIERDKLEEDCKRRLNWVLTHWHEQCMKRLRDEWMPKLKDRVSAVPLDDDKFAELVFSQPDYKDRKAREESNKVAV